MESSMCPIPVTQVTVTIITGGSLGSISVVLPCMHGRRRRLAGGYGDTAALPVTALTCSWVRATRLIPLATGWAAEQSFACKQDRSGAAKLPITGGLPIGS